MEYTSMYFSLTKETFKTARIFWVKESQFPSLLHCCLQLTQNEILLS
jgi:hypothetical protein